MKKDDLLKHGFDVVPKGGKERETYRMSFQTSPEIVEMLADTSGSEGKRGALKETLAQWVNLFDQLMNEKATNLMKKILSGEHKGGLKKFSEQFKSDNEEEKKAHTLLLFLAMSFEDSKAVSESIHFKRKINKTYTLTYEAKNALVSISEKLSLKKSDTFNLIVTTFCKAVYDMKNREKIEIKKLGSMICSVLKKQEEALNSLVLLRDSISAVVLEFTNTTHGEDLSPYQLSGLYGDSGLIAAIEHFFIYSDEVDNAVGTIWAEMNELSGNNTTEGT